MNAVLYLVLKAKERCYFELTVFSYLDLTFRALAGYSHARKSPQLMSNGSRRVEGSQWRTEYPSWRVCSAPATNTACGYSDVASLDSVGSTNALPMTPSRKTEPRVETPSHLLSEHGRAYKLRDIHA